MPEIALAPKSAAIPLLAAGMSAESVAREVGVHGRTVRRWLEEPDYLAAVEDARRVVLKETIAVLTAAVRKAADVTLVLLDDPSPAIRVRTVSEVFRALPLLTEHAALEDRMAALESRLDEQGSPRVPIAS